MWSDYIYKVCRRCGMKGFCSKETGVCRACLMDSCGDPTCEKHENGGAK